jgi:hypothetical protein
MDHPTRKHSSHYSSHQSSFKCHSIPQISVETDRIGAAGGKRRVSNSKVQMSYATTLFRVGILILLVSSQLLLLNPVTIAIHHSIHNIKDDPTAPPWSPPKEEKKTNRSSTSFSMEQTRNQDPTSKTTPTTTTTTTTTTTMMTTTTKTITMDQFDYLSQGVATGKWQGIKFSEGARRYQDKVLKQVKQRTLLLATSNSDDSNNSNHYSNNSNNSNNNNNDDIHHCHASSIDLEQPLLCLQQTTPNVTLIYPDDAEFHFQEIRIILAQWAQHENHTMHTWSGYSGPWIENYWISKFESMYDTRLLPLLPPLPLPLQLHNDDDTDGDNDNGTGDDTTNNESSSFCLSDLYGPYIPIFIPWVDQFVNHWGYPNAFVRALKSVLRPNVPYITVSQNDEGLASNHRRLKQFHDEFPNVLVLSAGGYGHVPIPLFKQPEPALPHSTRINVANRPTVFSYVGSLVNAPHDMRQRMHHDLTQLSMTAAAVAVQQPQQQQEQQPSPPPMELPLLLQPFSSLLELPSPPLLPPPPQQPSNQSSLSLSLSTSNATTTATTSNSTGQPWWQQQQQHQQQQQQPQKQVSLYQYFYGDDWRTVMAHSKLSLVPRGNGRTAFHLMETLQLGLVPVVVYSDLPWIPYMDFLVKQQKSLVYMIQYQDLARFVQQDLFQQQHLTNDEIAQKEEQIRSLRDSHFSYEGVLQQIQAFLWGTPNDLQCTPLPRSVKDE